jgi:hypothetical protein
MVAPDRSFELLSAHLTGNITDPGMHGLYQAFRDEAKDEVRRCRDAYRIHRRPGRPRRHDRGG